MAKWAQTCGPPYEAAIPQTHSHTNRAGHVYSRCRNVLLQQGSRVFRACTKASCVSFQRSTQPGQLLSRLDLHSRGSESLAEFLKKCKPRATKKEEISVSHLFAKHRTRFCPSETPYQHTWFGSCKNATERFPWVGSGWWFWNTAALHSFLRQRNRF